MPDDGQIGQRDVLDAHTVATPKHGKPMEKPIPLPHRWLNPKRTGVSMRSEGGRLFRFAPGAGDTVQRILNVRQCHTPLFPFSITKSGGLFRLRGKLTDIPHRGKKDVAAPFRKAQTGEETDKSKKAGFPPAWQAQQTLDLLHGSSLRIGDFFEGIVAFRGLPCAAR